MGRSQVNRFWLVILIILAMSLQFTGQIQNVQAQVVQARILSIDYPRKTRCSEVFKITASVEVNFPPQTHTFRVAVRDLDTDFRTMIGSSQGEEAWGRSTMTHQVLLQAPSRPRVMRLGVYAQYKAPTRNDYDNFGNTESYRVITVEVAEYVATVSTTTTATTGPSECFKISISPSSIKVKRQQSATFQVVVASLEGWSGEVLLSVTGSPPLSPGHYFTPPSVYVRPGADGVSTLSIPTDSSSKPLYELTVTGTSGAIVRTSRTQLVVEDVSDTSPQPLQPSMMYGLIVLGVAGALLAVILKSRFLRSSSKPR